MTDEDLVAGIASGDRDAFAALYRRRRPDVYRFALHMSGSPATAEDVVQEVFLAVIEQAAKYSPGRCRVVPWLLGIARNHVLRELTSGWSKRRDADADLSGNERTIDADPMRGLAQQESAAALRRLIAELPVRYREAVVLCDLRELTYEDAAVVLGCAVGTVRSRLHRGRALLASRLRKNESLFRTPAAGFIV